MATTKGCLVLCRNFIYCFLRWDLSVAQCRREDSIEVLRPKWHHFPKVENLWTVWVTHLRVTMNMKKAARARARNAVAAAAAAAPKNPSMKYTTWKFIFQGKVIRTHESPKKNAPNIGNLSQNAESSNNPNELRSKGLLAKAPVRRAPHTRKTHDGMRKLATKPSLVSRTLT
jgi:hypothetical protein